jgi:hypothetical protein
MKKTYFTISDFSGPMSYERLLHAHMLDRIWVIFFFLNFVSHFVVFINIENVKW